MRFIIDNNLSWRIAPALNERGHDAIHVRDLNLAQADDPDIVAVAREQSRVIVAQDLDFGTIMALNREKQINVIQLRLTDARPANQIHYLLKHLVRIQREMVGGTIVVITESRLRIRRWR